MSKEFEQGIKYVAENMSAALGSQTTNLWIDTIKDRVDILEKDIINKVTEYRNMDAKQLQGFVAEVWHKDSFNVNAARNGSFSKAELPNSNAFASADIKIGKNYTSLKFYKDAASSLKAQSETPYERYMALKNNAIKNGNEYNETFDEFLEKRNIKKEDINKSMYINQAKVIPADQLLKAQEIIEKKIAKEMVLGDQEQVRKLKEINSTLTDIVKDKRGNESIPLSREQAQKLTEAAKKGNVDEELLKECGLDVNNLVSNVDILKQSLKAGLSAAMLSAIITMAPTILNGIEMLISKGEIDKDSFKEAGYNALDQSAKSFIIGTITAAIVAACKTGKLGQALVDVNPAFIATSVVVVVGILENSIKYAKGEITKAQMADEIARMFIVTAFSVGTGVLASLWFGQVPSLATFGYMLGSFLGSVIGQFAYNYGKRIFMSFCVESGFTFFNIVDQNYTLPKEIMEEIGIEVFDYERFDYNKFKFDNFEVERFIPEEFEYDKFGITILHRGVIGIGKIGYA